MVYFLQTGMVEVVSKNSEYPIEAGIRASNQRTLNPFHQLRYANCYMPVFHEIELNLLILVP